MNYAKLINAIAACMGSDASTFTRYNKPVTRGEGNEAHMTARDAKMVVVDYKDTDVNFHIRAGQISFAGTPVTSEIMINHIKEAAESVIVFESLEAAVMNSLGSKYIPALKDINDIAKCYVNDRNDACLIQYGNGRTDEGELTVSIFVQCEDMVVILTVKE